MKRIAALILILALLPIGAFALTDGPPDDLPNFFPDPSWGDAEGWETLFDGETESNIYIVEDETEDETDEASDDMPDYLLDAENESDDTAEDSPAELTLDDWAKPEVEAARGLGLLIERLRTADLRLNVSRIEFAEICVRVVAKYLPPPDNFGNPFNDTADDGVITAYYYGITAGAKKNDDGSVSFNPHAAITRQDAVAMLTRAYKKVMMPGWTIGGDGLYDLNFAMPSPFDDDARVASYARAGVYFLTSNSVIKGYEEQGRREFRPQNFTSRQEALIIARRLCDLLDSRLG